MEVFTHLGVCAAYIGRGVKSSSAVCLLTFCKLFLCVNYIFALDCYDYAELMRNWWNACWILPFFV